MPIRIADSINNEGEKRLNTVAVPVQNEKQESTFVEGLAAGFRTESLPYNVFNSAYKNLTFDRDENFDPAQENLLNGQTQFTEEEREDLLSAQSKDEFLFTTNRVFQRRKDKQTFETSPVGNIFGMLAGGLTDPINLLPFGALSKGLKTSSKIGTTALQTTIAGGASIATSEGILLETQVGRTQEEFNTNVLAGTMLSGILGVAGGAIGAKLSKTETSLAKSMIETAPLPDVAKFTDHVDFVPRQTTVPQGLKKPDNFIGKTFFAPAEAIASRTSPMVRLAKNRTESVRSVAEKLIEQTVEKPDVATRALPDSVETMVKLYDGDKAKATQGFMDSYKQYRKSSKLQGTKVMNQEAFSEEIARGMRRGDVSDDPFVQKAIDDIRPLFNKLKDQAVEVGLLPADVNAKTADSYLTRVWDSAKVAQNQQQLRNILTEHLTEQLSKVQPDDYLKSVGTEKYIQESVDEVLGTLRGQNHFSQNTNIKIIDRGPLKERTLDIPDVKAEEFLENDVLKIMERFTRVLAPEIELKRAFGTTDFSTLKADMIAEHKKATAGLEGKELVKLDQNFQDGLTDLEHMWDITRGTYFSGGDPNSMARRASAFLRDYNFLRSMGTVAVASIPDIASITRMGFGRTLKYGLKPMIKNAATLRQSLNTKQAQRYGKAVEAVLANRQAAMLEIGDPFANRTSFIERMSTTMSAKYGNLSLGNYWNNMAQEIAVMTAEPRLIDNIMGGAPNLKEQKLMNFLGLDQTKQAAIKAQIEKYGIKGTDRIDTNIELWDDEFAVRSLKAAITKEVDRHVIRKSIGDTPIFTNTPLGKILAQFTNFMLASNQRLLMSGLQQGDLSALTAFSTMGGLGMLVYWLRTPSDRLSNKEEDWLVQGLDRSGIASIPFYVGNIVNQSTPERKAAAALGPTMGLFKDADKAISGLFKEGYTQKELDATIRLLPGQNLLWLWGIERIADKKLSRLIGESLDLPERRKPKRARKRTTRRNR